MFELHVGDRIEIPVHFDLWMRGARFGTVSSIRKAGGPVYYVRMDHPQVRRRVKLLVSDLPFVKFQ